MLIIDNFLEKSVFEEIYSGIMGNDFPWFRRDCTTTESDEDRHSIMFFHLFYQDGITNSLFCNLLTPVLEKLDPTFIIRVKANLYPINERYIEHGMHRDNNFPHKSAIFYLNTNNGFTILEDGTKIHSIKNRMVLFDGSILHRSTNCNDEKFRINLNFNYI